ncbi:lipopolysaccharide export system protein LptA [Duganella sp. CF402]|uniref:lipopolysaccharide transport periplasmic protein LptA n=1 Tax=unclassified Duganella TaxID=2636909 RepID=UPI0008D17E99|nr:MULTISPECIES: lipopolysaccharide transport periplasmic protein LptA [unclassified Duganella]RZT11331.1 lipopolysaccharide export system protein LptA [Duganella sp. BK701]SEK69961.1 lipopolysaccharide export system protein LptA [Duganella sp. CF402]
MKNILLCLLFALPIAHAERADGYQKTVIKARDSASDMVSKVTTLTGNVEIQRGSLLIRAEHAVLTEDAQGYQRVVMTAQAGEPPVSFRQKRDGAGNQWMEGQALQVTYDDKTEIVDLTNQAQARRTSDGLVTDEVTGERIIYKSREEQYLVTQLPGSTATGDRRGKMVLQPIRKDPLINPLNSTAAVPQQ